MFLSFAAKTAMSDEAPLSKVKRRFERGETFSTLRASLEGDLAGARPAVTLRYSFDELISTITERRDGDGDG